jgi:hypothetical protein
LHEKIFRLGKDRSYIGDFWSSPNPLGSDKRRQTFRRFSPLALSSPTGEDDFFIGFEDLAGDGNDDAL